MKKLVFAAVLFLMLAAPAFAERIFYTTSLDGSVYAVNSTENRGIYHWYFEGQRYEALFHADRPKITLERSDGYKIKITSPEDGVFLAEDSFGTESYWLDETVGSQMVWATTNHFFENREKSPDQ